MARQVADQTAYAASFRDPVRPMSPYVPTERVTTGQAGNLPLIGVIALAAVILLLEHQRRRRGR